MRVILLLSILFISVYSYSRDGGVKYARAHVHNINHKCGTHSIQSYWMERKFTISKIKSIDNVPYEQSMAHLSYLRKCEEERKRKEKKKQITKTSAKDDLTEMKLVCMVFFGMLGLIFGGAAFGGIGAIGGIVAGSLFAIWFVDERFKE